MKFSSTLSIVAIACALAACGGGGGDSGSSTGGNGNGNPPTTNPSPETPKENYPTESQPGSYVDANRAQIFNTINKYRTTCGFSSVKQNSMLDTSAMGHANYLQINDTFGHTQNNTNPGFTGADLLTRVQATGYAGARLGEIANSRNAGSLIAGTSASGIETSANAPTGEAMINRLFATVYHLELAVGEWNDMGVGMSISGNKTPLPGETVFYATSVVNFGVAAGGNAPVYSGGQVRSFPCDGIAGVSPIFTQEIPSPYPSRDFNVSPMGTPTIFASANGGSISIETAEMVQVSNGAPVATKILNASDDVNKVMANSVAFVIPDQPLSPNTAYRISVKGSSDGKALAKAITFTTGTQN